MPSYAIRYERNGSALTYSADTAPDDRVIELATGSDLFLCEATLLANDEELGQRGHCTGAEAATMAAAARVKRLVLTHYSQEATENDLIGAARGIYSRRGHRRRRPRRAGDLRPFNFSADRSAAQRALVIGFGFAAGERKLNERAHWGEAA